MDNQITTNFPNDPYLLPYKQKIRTRIEHAIAVEANLTRKQTLADFASGHEYFGLHFKNNRWVFREWAPNATDVYLIGDFSHWHEKAEYKLARIQPFGVWAIELPAETIKHGMRYKLKVYWDGGCGERIPAYARRVVQNPDTNVFDAQVWSPEKPYEWQNTPPERHNAPFIYEAHIGMAQERQGIGSYREFRDLVLPIVADAGYNTIQLMAIMEHPYYGSFGYHVSNFFAASSRFGTPEDLKSLIDTAHGMGLCVIMDLIHSHAVKNEVEGISRFDGTLYQYFHEGERGIHSAWDSRCFNYAKPEVLHFLLSNCRFWLDEYKFDGFRFDGITSMLYLHHGLGKSFTDYDMYFDDSVDTDALTYLTLANKLIHNVRPDAITIAEDMSGMPGLAAPIEDGGCGFDYRLAMGIPDLIFKLLKKVPDEDWDMGNLWFELTNRRSDEQTISYAECHDQAIVGGKTIIFELMDKEIYEFMRASDDNITVARGMALHKMIRLITLATAGHGYLNFMGNEFGHPEWVDFPREGNDWSYRFARRQWNLRYDANLKYRSLAEFDKEMLEFAKETNFLIHPPVLLKLDNAYKQLFFKRGNLIFLFNFHPDKSQTDMKVEVAPGKYSLCLDTDRKTFGGYSRIESDQSFFTVPQKDGKEIRNYLSVYLPSRTAMVLKRN